MPTDTSAIREAVERIQRADRLRTALYGLLVIAADPEDVLLVATSALAMIEALEWYASKSTYQRPLTEYGWGPMPPIDQDRGERARAALAAGRTEQEPADGR